MIRYNEAVNLSKKVHELDATGDRTKYEVLIDKTIKRSISEGKTFAYVERYSETYLDEVKEKWEMDGKVCSLKEWLRKVDDEIATSVLSKYRNDGYRLTESTYGYNFDWR